MKISCPCSIKTSHNYSSFDFQHGNFIQSHGVLSLEKVDFLNLKISSLTIEKVSDKVKESNFVIKISLPESIDDQQIKFLLLSIAQQISFFINLSEQAVNPHHGTFYVDVDLFNVKIENLSSKDITGGPFGLQVKMGMQSGVSFDLSSISLKSTKYQELVELFYEGTRSELPKSKYFHWFLILEHLECSNKYTEQFKQVNHVFSEQKQLRIRKVAAKCKSEREKNLILNILQPKYTLKNRHDKLYEFIVDTLNISSFKVGLKTEVIDKQTISEIVTTRHSLFHPGVSFNEAILWFKLYPLVVEILKKMIIHEIEIN
jgi:hypothetical protein